jgi:hypothetical protein
MRRKGGKARRSWSIVESRRHGRGKVSQRHVLYLGKLNDSQLLARQKTISVFDEEPGNQRQIALFSADRKSSGREVLRPDSPGVPTFGAPSAMGTCWLANELWNLLGLETLVGFRLCVSPEGTDREKVLQILRIYRLLPPDSSWRLHRLWFGTRALADLLGGDEPPVRLTRSTFPYYPAEPCR